jgi:hypothetical protein
MLRKPRNAAVGAFVLLALASASHRAAAQDTSRAGEASPDTSAYTGIGARDTTDTTLRTGVEQVDTTARPGQAGGMSDTSVTTDTSAIQPIPGDSTDSTKIGVGTSPLKRPGTSSDSTSGASPTPDSTQR